MIKKFINMFIVFSIFASVSTQARPNINQIKNDQAEARAISTYLRELAQKTSDPKRKQEILALRDELNDSRFDWEETSLTDSKAMRPETKRFRAAFRKSRNLKQENEVFELTTKLKDISTTEDQMKLIDDLIIELNRLDAISRSENIDSAEGYRQIEAARAALVEKMDFAKTFVSEKSSAQTGFDPKIHQREPATPAVNVDHLI